MNICIDLGGTNLKAGLVEGDCLQEHASVSIDPAFDFRQVMQLLERVVKELLSSRSDTEPLPEGIGLCIPGIIDINRNQLISVNQKHTGAEVFDFNAWSAQTFDLPLVMENDARAAMAGEWQAGRGKGFSDLVMITLGTGIGTSAVINGQLLYGKHFQAGCLGGHFTLNHKGGSCTCGNLGCAESEASSSRLMENILSMTGGADFISTQKGNINFEQLFTMKKSGHSMAGKIIENHLKVWSAAVVTLIHAYDPEVVILGGGIMNSGEEIIPYVQDYVDRYAWTPAHRVEILPSTRNNFIALLGMNYLVNLKKNK